MSAVDASALDPAFVDDPTIEVASLSSWFGQKVALSELSCSFGPGVTGLLGPNGAGKTTLMRLIVGLLPPRSGSVRVLGHDPRTNREIQRQISIVPEDEAVPALLTARQFVEYTARLHSLNGRDAVDAALSRVALLDEADRRLEGFSKGMRQRAKVAASLVTDPSVLILDEPLNGADPVQRQALISLFTRLGADGKTVIVSSHVLHEVERLAERVVVVVGGRLAAAGSRHAIREAMHDRPRRLLIRSSNDRRLARALLTTESVIGVDLNADHALVRTSSATKLAADLAPIAVEYEVSIREVIPLDESLEAMFKELTT